ncbi:hypothetical protein [Microcoleus sp. D2_18a_B4]
MQPDSMSVDLSWTIWREKFGERVRRVAIGRTILDFRLTQQMNLGA